MPTGPSTHPRRAFTLIELLVVIAVIAILISLILPALGQSRQSGKATACLSGVRQLGMALSGYVTDNKGYSPGHHTWRGAVYIVWPARIRPYRGPALGLLVPLRRGRVQVGVPLRRVRQGGIRLRGRRTPPDRQVGLQLWI